VTSHVLVGRGGEGRLISSETTLEDDSALRRSTSQTKKRTEVFIRPEAGENADQS
jgi:hypothetical protein